MLKSFWFWLLILFIAIQPFSFNVAATLPIKSNETLEAPKEVLSILKRSCFDCHSSEVKAPWYYTVAPVSWYTQRNVKKAREIINFSKWNTYTKEKQIKILNKLPKAIVIRMPLISYLYAHEEAKLTESEKKLLKSWSKELKQKLK
ncbi:MAG TPA: cytochrome C [Campylobacterales bacterium]|nr:cytochrome C [Campylobacterales bacterium]